MLRNARVMVTGCAGFIGSNICRALQDENELVGIDDISTGKRENMLGLDIEFHEFDINETEKLAGSMKGCDYVLHQGAIPSVPRSVAEPQRTNHANVDGTLSVLEAARACDVKKVVFAASSAAYGDAPEQPKLETMLPKPLSPYAIQKLTCEMYCRNFSEMYGLGTVALRYFNVFGPAQDPASTYAAVVPKFITCAIKEETAPVYGDGGQTRDFVYVDNVISANVKAALSSSTGRVMNIGCAERISLNGMLELVEEFSGKAVEREYFEARAGDVRDSMANIELAKREIDYTPVVDFREGLKRTYDWFLERS